jgi:hypothetical protein
MRMIVQIKVSFLMRGEKVFGILGKFGTIYATSNS